MYFFVPFARPCTHHNCGVISGSHACRDCVWPIILDAELYTTCPSVMSHQVQCNISTFEALLKKDVGYLFLERCIKSENIWLHALTQSNCWYSSLSFEYITAFYFVTEYSDIVVFVRLRVCYVTMHSHFTRPWTV